ncbi:uncharacterized protein PFL1_01526 [Pseudozyma flocculosa PF-1]|uniref:4-hydroxy-3-methoxy-5-polyprenylbenzoate decarboxylase n=1 Tax=Pseudozyma flocculosa TaxID=84751 RepID=A0A5C3FDU1_9BASI|nr:uncharacterized protein PFL1_01526 [Pseudozyma flocculosa PF-1]EPQ31342.1 hypothetical protein PFL1_01526 [Pseudozyma flocculosa PF-1]SPO41807.1 related to COQ4 - responsible for restoring ubiquinone biosynthesis in coq4 mutant [Pseudozyma flocculosa]
MHATTRTASPLALLCVGPRSPVATSSRVRLAPAATRALSHDAPRSAAAPRSRIDEVDHRQTSTTAKLLLTAGSALGLLNNPARGDLLSILTQVSSPPSLPHLLALMRSTESGRRLLVQRPSINSDTVDVEYLSQLKRGQFGREWIEWLKENGVGPDGRAEADYMPTTEQKFLVQRYRESHDFYHLLLRMPVTQLGETVIKYFEVAQMKMPVAGFAALGGTLRLLASGIASLPPPSTLFAGADQRQHAVQQATSDSAALRELDMLRTLVPWATHVGRTASPLIGVEWEKCWERDINQMRQELGIPRPPIDVPRFVGRRKKAGGKRRGWPTKILEAQRAREQRERERAAETESPSPTPP